MVVYCGVLVVTGANININNKFRKSALGYAEEKKRERMIEMLRAAGKYYSCKYKISDQLLYFCFIY